MLTGEEWKRLALPIAIFVLLAAAGAALIWQVNRMQIAARQQLALAQTERAQNREKLSKISDEEREVREKLEVYKQLKSLNIIGAERRLEWADAVNRIRLSRELPDLRYRVEPKRLLSNVTTKASAVEFYSSTMKLSLGLLHEGDLLRLLADLRASGNAYYAVQNCALNRTAQGAVAPNLAARLTGECQIDLITIVDKASRS